jgi:hypothetical protein
MTFRNIAGGINYYTNHELGKINFAGNDRLAGEFGLGAQIRSVARKYWDDATTNDNPAELQFWTNPDGPTAIQNRMTIDESGNVTVHDGYLAVGGTIPTFGSQLYVKNLTDNTASNSNALLRLDGPSSDITMGVASDHDWIQTWASKPLSLNPVGNNVGIGIDVPTEQLHIDGNTQIDNGYLTVGGTTSSIIRYEMKEFVYMDASNWSVGPGWESKYVGVLSRPAGATEITIDRIEWDIHGYHTDADEPHEIEMQIGSTFLGSVDGYASNFGSGYRPIIINKAVDAPSIISAASSNVYFWAWDYNDNCSVCTDNNSHYESMRAKVYYHYSVSAQNGDIIAGGRVYANSNQSVGDVAEYFPVIDGVEPGYIIALNTDKDNQYQLCDREYSNNMVGVISKAPSVVLNDPKEGPPVGLAGRVIVKLVKSNELIQRGEFITSSNQKGLGKLASRQGPVIGYAVKNQKKGEDFVEILLQPGRYYSPEFDKPPTNTSQK